METIHYVFLVLVPILYLVARLFNAVDPRAHTRIFLWYVLSNLPTALYCWIVAGNLPLRDSSAAIAFNVCSGISLVALVSDLCVLCANVRPILSRDPGADGAGRRSDASDRSR